MIVRAYSWATDSGVVETVEEEEGFLWEEGTRERTEDCCGEEGEVEGVGKENVEDEKE